jgi:hypothetical protein
MKLTFLPTTNHQWRHRITSKGRITHESSETYKNEADVISATRALIEAIDKGTLECPTPSAAGPKYRFATWLRDRNVAKRKLAKLLDRVRKDPSRNPDWSKIWPLLCVLHGIEDSALNAEVIH